MKENQELSEQLAQLRRENAELKQKLLGEVALSDDEFVASWADKLHANPGIAMIQQAHNALCERMRIDSSNLFFNDMEERRFVAELCYPPLKNVSAGHVSYPHDTLPWISAEIIAGNQVRVNSLAEMPAEGCVDKMVMDNLHVRSFMAQPVVQEANTVAILDTSERKAQRSWTDAECQLVRRFANLLYGQSESL